MKLFAAFLASSAATTFPWSITLQDVNWKVGTSPAVWNFDNCEGWEGSQHGVHVCPAAGDRTLVTEDIAFNDANDHHYSEGHQVVITGNVGITIGRLGDFIVGPGATFSPTSSPTAYPTPVPTTYPTPVPTTYPTPEPTTYPTPSPTAYPTPVPTAYPTPEPTTYPTPEPTTYPTPEPTAYPTPVPTAYPTPEPTTYPTPEPTTYPTPEPTTYPTPYPTPEPTTYPTPEPTTYPTPSPTSHVCTTNQHNCDKGYGGVCYTPTLADYATKTTDRDEGVNGVDDHTLDHNFWVITEHSQSLRYSRTALENGDEHAYKCGCKEGYNCVAGCSPPFTGHKCEATRSPTPYPTSSPTAYPTPEPTTYPTPVPTAYPTPEPTTYPTPSPTAYPTSEPTTYPTPEPTTYPTPSPTTYPTPSPTAYPTLQGDLPVCSLTTCIRSEITLHGKKFWHTLVQGPGPKVEKFHCEKEGRSGCKCVCDMTLECSIWHHTKDGKIFKRKHCAGHYGADTEHGTGLLDPVPGAQNSAAYKGALHAFYTH